MPHRPQLQGRAKRRKLIETRRQTRLEEVCMDVVDDKQQIPEPDAVEHLNPEPVLQPVQNLFTGRIFPPVVKKYSIGHSHFCQHCQTIRFLGEPLNCCHNEKVQLPPLSCYPPELIALFQRKDLQSKNFMDNIRAYNSAMAFASFGAQIAFPPGRRPYCF